MGSKPETSIYLDYQATTPTDPRVVEAMLPFFTKHCGNPHSSSHAYGWVAEEAVDEARDQIASLIGATRREIIFTSGATESNNLAIKGAARYYAPQKKHIVTVRTEHKCILESCRALEKEGIETTYLPVNASGLIDLDQLRDVIREDTLMVSVMAVNNEIGVIQPLKEIGAICEEKDVMFHCDAAQGFGRIPLDMKEMNIAMLSISGHKMYGPKGIGALYIRRKPRVGLEPIVSGGGQEKGLRSGTVATPLAVGLGKAAEIAAKEMDKDRKHVEQLRDLLLSKTLDTLPGIILNGHREQRWPGNVSLTFEDINNDLLMTELTGIAVSSGSACSSATAEPSFVLKALRGDNVRADATVRIGFGRFSTKDEILSAAKQISAALAKLRK